MRKMLQYSLQWKLMILPVLPAALYPRHWLPAMINSCLIKKKKKKKELLSIVLILFSSILKLINLFLAVLGLHCCVGSSRGEPGLPPSCSAQASRSSGFSCGGAWANKFQELWHMGSIAVACGPESAGSVLTLRHVGSSQNRG